MTRTNTKIIDFEKLENDPATSMVVQLMMACSDMQRANEAQTHFKKQKKSNSQTGKLMYFIRLQLGHLFEGLKIIKKN